MRKEDSKMLHSALQYFSSSAHLKRTLQCEDRENKSLRFLEGAS